MNKKNEAEQGDPSTDTERNELPPGFAQDDNGRIWHQGSWEDPATIGIAWQWFTEETRITREEWRRLQGLADTNSALVAANKALRGGDPEPSFCAYCLEVMPKGDPDAIVDHLLTCPTHPVNALGRENDELRAKLTEAEAIISKLSG